VWSFYFENRTNKIDKIGGNPDGFNKLNLS
jgi:hypothetical protein